MVFVIRDTCIGIHKKIQFKTILISIQLSTKCPYDKIYYSKDYKRMKKFKLVH